MINSTASESDRKKDFTAPRSVLSNSALSECNDFIIHYIRAIQLLEVDEN